MTTITSKRVTDLELGDRLSIPGTGLSSPVTFLWGRGSDVVVELENGASHIWPTTTEVRVVS